MRDAWFLALLCAGIGSVGLTACSEDPAERQQRRDEVYRESVEAYRRDDWDQAVAAARRAIEIDPDFVNGWFGLARAQSSLQHADEAIAAYGRVLELEPDNARAAHNTGNVYFRLGRHAEAASWYRRAVEIEPRYQLALFNYGWVLRQLNEQALSEEMFGRCLEIEPTRPQDHKVRFDCLYYLGTLRFRAGDYASAAGIMERVLAVDQAHPEARHFLGMSYRRLGRLDEAEQQLSIHREILQAHRKPPIQLVDDP